MRQILELSEHQFIEISEEKEFLELYLNTESMRMGRKLDFAFEIDPALDEDDTLVPTMILQPFVENAIWHGISHKKEKGLITIRFLLRGEWLLCEVEDNGVGRNRRSDALRPHKSKAIEITRRRLELLPNNSGQDARLEIIDLTGKDDLPAGTKVQLWLPFYG